MVPKFYTFLLPFQFFCGNPRESSSDLRKVWGVQKTMCLQPVAPGQLNSDKLFRDAD